MQAKLIIANLFQRANVLQFTVLVRFKTAEFMYTAYHCVFAENIQRNFVWKKHIILCEKKHHASDQEVVVFERLY